MFYVIKVIIAQISVQRMLSKKFLIRCLRFPFIEKHQQNVSFSCILEKSNKSIINTKKRKVSSKRNSSILEQIANMSKPKIPRCTMLLTITVTADRND